MTPRPVLLTGMLGAAVAGPMVATNLPPEWQGQPSPGHVTQSVVASNDFPIAPTTPPATQLQHNGSLIYRSPAPLEGSFVSIGDALRLDVSRQWVYARWARKSTGLADPELFGVRAPLVTGSQMHDIAGAVSYYFDGNGVVQRLRFHGRTADTTQLVSLVQQRFGMSPQPAGPGEQLYQVQSRRGVESELRTRPEAVLWGTSPHTSFVVDLEVNRPGSGRLVARPKPTLSLPPGTPDPPIA
ncbi:MAG: DUF6690 family protein, partial [Planctomycetota bacterium]